MIIFILQACGQNSSSISFETSFDNWDQQQFFNSALTLKSSSYEQDDDHDNDEDFQSKDIFTTTDPFDSSTALNEGDGGGFNTIMGNNNISCNPLMFGYHTNGVYDHSNDFLMNFYASQCTNYSPFMANSCNIVPTTLTNIHHPSPLSTNSSSINNSCSSSYNPFHQHFCVLTSTNASIQDGDHDINSNNDNWANFDSSVDNFADFDSHFANMPATFTTAAEGEEESNESENFTHNEPPCFIATTQVLEISSVPPSAALEQPQETSPIKFQLGSIDSIIPPATTINNIIKSFDELDDEEFFSLRDDSNDMSSLTDDNDKKFNYEQTEVPDDDDDDFASADER